MMRRLIFTLLCLLVGGGLFAQSPGDRLQQLEQELAGIKAQQKVLEGKIEEVKLEILRADLAEFGLPARAPGEEVLEHAAMSLVYSEEHEQAKWVAHIILPDVLDGKVARSNDFRTDPLVATGSAEEADYFLKEERGDGSTDYDGYGYDRGHLAPSADFRWSARALSESYFYSNMSPQLPDFNRGIWADLEAKIRGYISRNPTSQLYVVTGPVLKGDLSKVSRSVNGLALPKTYFKVVLDLAQGKAIGFLLPNAGTEAPLSSFVRSIDEVEAATGLDFFPALDDVTEARIEAQKVAGDWIPADELRDVAPIHPPVLPRNTFNTVQAKVYAGKNDAITVVGKVVGTRTSRKGNVLLNLDKQFPDQIFTVFIRKDQLPNFPYDAEETWKGQYVKVTAKVIDLGGTPAMFIEHDRQIESYDGPTGR